MGLTNWKGNIVRKADVIVAKNYLIHDEIDNLNRLTTLFLESAELRVKNRRDLTLSFWRNNVDQLLMFNDFPVLNHVGTRSNAQMENTVKQVYDVFHERRKQQQFEQAEQDDLAELQQLQQQLKNKDNK
mgnify:FL=1